MNVWGEIKALCGLDYFEEFANMFAQRTVAWRRLAHCRGRTRKRGKKERKIPTSTVLPKLRARNKS